MFACPRALWPLVAVFTAGYLASYLLPTLVGRLGSGLGLSPAGAGLVGSTLLLCSAAAGFTLASRVQRTGPRRAARTGLLLMLLGYGCAALSSAVPAVVAGCALGGFGSGTATAVAAAGIAAATNPHRASVLGLLSVSATAGALYLSVPHLDGGHRPPFVALALIAALVWPATGRLHSADAAHSTGVPRAPLEVLGAAAAHPSRLPHLRSGLVLAAAMLCWSLSQNALWGVSNRIGTVQAGLSEVAVGVVFAAGLGAGLAGVSAAGALGSRLGRAVPVGCGTVAIALCVAVSSSATGPVSFASGEILWNAFYPVVLSYLIGLAASMDPRGRWAVFAGSASSLGVACGPVAGSLLSAWAGFPVMGLVLGGVLLLTAMPMTAVALHTGGRPLVAGAVRRRGGAPVAVLAGTTGAPAGHVPQVGAAEQEVAEISLRPLTRRVRSPFVRTAPRSARVPQARGAERERVRAGAEV
ncbi:MFS transporter [Streptomyces sp. NPDC058657]|uniref:MFS transporter n=1 Tax=unclassified Streptomyces TaxID=2593676 RepID=UPI00365BE392